MIPPILFIYKILTRFRGEKENNQPLATIIFTAFLVIAVIVVFGLIHKACLRKDEPKIDTKAIEQINHRNAEIERNRVEGQQDASRGRVDEYIDEAKRAEEDTANVRAKDYSNTKGSDLDKKAGNYR